MIDCNNTKNYFSEKRRMTKRTSDGECKIRCSDCPLSGLTNRTPECMTCVTFEMYHPEEAIEKIQRWSDEHPPKTYLSELLKNYPNTLLNDDGTPKRICPYELGLISKNNCRINRINRNCVECWNQPMPAEGGEE